MLLRPSQFVFQSLIFGVSKDLGECQKSHMTSCAHSATLNFVVPMPSERYNPNLHYVTIYSASLDTDRTEQAGEDLARNFEGQAMDCRV